MIKNIVIFSCVWISALAHGMEIDVGKDHVAEQQSHVKRNFIFLSLGECETIKQAHQVLASVGQVSKKSYKKINCPFFMTQVIQVVSLRYNEPCGTIARRLQTEGARRYKKLNDKVIMTTITGNFANDSLLYVSKLMDKGADPNFSSLKFGTTPLMRAVRLNNPDLVELLLQRKASPDACDAKKRSVRQFNMIYDAEKLKAKLEPLIEYMCLLEACGSAATANRQLTEHARSFLPLFIREINDALYIDKMLEDSGAELPCQYYSEHPLVNMLLEQDKGIVLKRTLRKIYGNNNACIFEDVPKVIRSLLCHF